MANYNCTPLGCVQDATGIYPDLPSCQSACIHFGCPPQLTTNTDIIFVYDGSGSYANPTSRLGIFKAATAWTETLAQAGWVGTADHTIAGSIAAPATMTQTTFPGAGIDGSQLNMGFGSNSDSLYCNINGNVLPMDWYIVGREEWLAWATIPYLYTNIDPATGLRMPWNYGGQTDAYVPAPLFSTTEIPMNVQEEYFSIYKYRVGMNSSNPAINTGATYPTNPTLVVAFCHQTSYGFETLSGLVSGSQTAIWKTNYTMWSELYANNPGPADNMKAFLFPVKNLCEGIGGSSWPTLQNTLTTGILSILNGNQDDVANGGTGTLDGTWITYTQGQTMPNGNVCPYDYCTTAPFGPATQNPCVENLNCPNEVLCYWSPSDISSSPGNQGVDLWTGNNGPFYGGSVNTAWIAGQPTWGGLQDKGWGINVSLLATDSAILGAALDSSIGTVVTPATQCISAETSATLDYPYTTLQNCNDNCFPSLDPWYCDGQGTPCYQDPQGTFTFGVGGIYATSQDAETACTQTCNTTSGWTCGVYGCIQATGDTQFDSLSACTAQCQSYSCTTQGCYGPFQGTGSTGTYHNAENPTWGLTACTASCYHFECVTSSYAASGILPNDYNSTVSGTTNGCLQLPGSGGTSPNALGFNEYTTLSACTGACISWQCCEPLSIGPDSVMYVYYDITSMDATQTENAIKGIIDWTENHLEFTGHTYHMLWWSERWLVYPTIAYNMDGYRFTENSPSSYLTDPNNLAAGITYDAPAQWGYMGFGQGSQYWITSTSRPVEVIREVYHPTTGFDSWISLGNYTGNATHTVHDSFAPGSTGEPGYSYLWADGQTTKGYGGVMTASTSDDVITIVFEDESSIQYHANGASFTGEPTSDWKADHARYFAIHNAVTATTSGGGTGGNIRSFLYPTVTSPGGNSANRGFALHSIAAIDSGTNSPLDGKWTNSTYPLDNNAYGYAQPWTHAQCEFNMVQLSLSNPYWDGTTPTWGGLDQYGWSINFRFDTYEQTIFETDLTSFMTGTSQACTTICTSGHTAIDAEFPYSSQTLCEGLVSLGECTGCTRFNCGDNGCYTAVTGEYSCLADCTASCYSYSCTTTGCTDHNSPTGTTFPYTSTDGVSYYSYYGTGGTFSSNTDCTLVCESWECGASGCYVQPGGTGGTYSSETHCQINCSGYNCDNQFGCIPEIGNDAQFDTLLDCQTGCTYWECNAIVGCIEQTGTSTGSIYEFATQTACTNYCASFNCGDNGCYQLSNLSGTYQDITQLPIVSSAACTASCVSYNCGTSGCSEVTGTGGTFSTSASCTASCVSYSCGTITDGGCGLWNVPNYGTGGTFTSTTACSENCISYECGPEGLGASYNGSPTGCIPQTYSGGSYSSLTHCLEVGMDYLSPDYTNTGDCTTWNCSANGCVVVSGSNGQFSTLSACTGQCTSYSCSTGTMSEGSRVPGSGGCNIYNAPLYGTGGTFFYLWECSGGCRSWDCTSTGCTEVSADVGSGGTYLTAIACDSGCTSYNCGDTGCTSQVGSGGTYFNATNPDWGATACTATCISYDCSPTVLGQVVAGCLQYNSQGGGGSGGTFYNATASISALTACTAACISYECTTGGCSDIQGTGMTGTFSAESACTGSCIAWGCLNNPIETDSKIYAYYDTTSMDLTAVQQAITGLENWVLGFQNFTGSLYHTLNNDERWLSWASSVYHSQFTAGTSTIFQNPTAMLVKDWASGMSMTNVYDNMAPGNSTFLFPGITTTGPAPAADHDDNVLVITFIDESGPSNGLNSNNVYTSDDAGSPNNAIPNFAATLSNPLDQPTPTWKVDFTAYSATYATVTTAGGSLNCYMYPTASFSPQSPDNELFALHVVAAIDSGNQTVGAQGENWQAGTAPRRLTSGGILGGVPELCAIADLTALEVSNPYLLTVDAYTPNVGKLDTKGWGYNINFGQYTTNGFNTDLSSFLNTIQSNLSLCVSATTIQTSQYPHLTLSACTGECYSYECTYNGCVPFNGTGGTPTYYSTLADCESACTSWNCMTTGCTTQAGTGGTFTSSGGCVTACTSYNCEDITTYTPSQSWPSANGCIEQTGSGGTFYGAAAGSSGSSIFGWTACTAECQSWTCTVNCSGGTTGCTSWPNTAATYTALTSCTANCSIDWYCTEAYINDTCNGLIDSTYVDMNFYGSGVPYFSDDVSNHNLTFSNYKFTRILDPSLQGQYSSQCVSPFNASYYLPGLPTNSIDPLQPYLPSTLGRYSYIIKMTILDDTITTPYPANIVAGPYTDWSSTISGILSLNNTCIQSQGLSVNSTWMDIYSAFGNCDHTLNVNYNWCYCYEVPCDVFCDDGYVTIPSTAQGPFTSSGAAESACCENITYSCVTATTLDSCSGKTTLPGQYNSTTDAWDWLTVNLPNTDLTTLAYESTTPAVNVSGACAGPNGGVLYEIEPVSYSLLNANISYNTWNLFINQMQGAGTTGILSGMSYSNVNNYVYAQSGQTIKVCDEICHCSVKPCECIELYDGTGQYTTYADCISGTTGLPACCPDTGTTSATSWDCTSGITYLPICDTKPYIGAFNDQFTAVDYFRVGNPTGIFGHKRMVRSYTTNNSGVNVPMVGYTWADVQANTNPAYQWQSCYKQQGIGGQTLYYLPYEYVKSISHPGVTGGLEYTNWNAFYTAAAASFTLTTSLNALQVCQSIDSQYWGSNNFGCVVDTGKCCNREDCFCYELYTTGGTYFTETQCEHPLSGCCPEYTGWTCEMVDPVTGALSYQLPCFLVTQSSPITGLVFTDNAFNGFNGQAQCNADPVCDPPVPGDFWSCVTTEVSTCDPNGDSLGEITGTTLGPNMNGLDFTYGTLLGTNTQYPFSSSTDQMWPLLQSTSSSIGSYLGGYGQVETILTDYHYYDPYTPLSSTTFQLGSVNVVGTSIVNPNDATSVYPLPYTLPIETCMGINATGGTGMPLFSILSVSHRDINGNTPYGSWGEFIDAAILLGYSVTTNNNVAQLGAMYPLTFGCSETMITTQTSPIPTMAWYSGCGWTFDMVPCLCDTVCCCESGFTQGYNTEPECLDPVSGCCPSISSYTCTINGCIDPGNGSGEYTGLTAFADCEAVCKEWKCVSSSTITDSCSNKTIMPSLGTLPDISEYSPSYGPLNRGPFDALAYFCDPVNGLQGASFDQYKWDCGNGCGWSLNDCDAPLGAYKYINQVTARHTPSGSAAFTVPGTLGPANNWAEVINWLNTGLQQNGYYPNAWDLTMDYNTVAQILWNGVPGTPFEGGYELIPMVGPCYCTPGPCDCILTGGTGHSGTYHLITGQTQCEWDCCSGVTIPECAILITGREEGVLYYDFDTNTTTKLFDEPGYERIDIAARQNKLWIYADTGAAHEIKEYDVIYYPYFQYAFNRNISVLSSNIGRGLTPTEDPNILLTANDKVYKVDITANVAATTYQFDLPSGLTCTGDIMYDNVSGNMIITYGSGATQYVGKFDGAGNLLEESHINSTTLGIGTGETIDSLFNYGTWTPPVPAFPGQYQYFTPPYNGPIYGITTERRVIELLQNPLQFAPVEAQTLTLVNQISNKVHGATNIFNIVNGMMHGCVNITGTTSSSDVYWCDELLGCLPYPSNVTPPNSFGPYTTLADCQTLCNFVCGDCASSCECELVQTPVSSGCDPEPTMADCIAQNLANTNVIDGGDGCCDCIGCDSVTFYGYQSQGQWTQYIVNSNVSFGNFATMWSASATYSVGDVVIFADANGNRCCYTYVNIVSPNSNMNPYDEWVYYSNNYASNIPQVREKIYWIPCDEDCPSVTSWSCVTGTTIVSNDTCATSVDVGVQGLSYTPLITYIAAGGFALWNTPFENLKWDSGSQQYPLPASPCPAVIGHWAKIIGCRITHIANAQPTVAQAAIKTTWADFVDHINSLFGGVPYNFPYTDNWQAIENVLGNHVGIECIFEYCECDSSAPGCTLCMSNVYNFGSASVPNYSPMIDVSTTYYGGALGDGTPPYNFNDLKQVRDIITDPSNGLFNTDFREMKWEKMPWTGPGGTPMTYTHQLCSPQFLNNNGYFDCDPFVADLGPSNGNTRTFSMGWAFGGGNFPPGQWFNWADLLNDVAAVINSTPLPAGMAVTSSDNYDELNVKAEFYFVNVLGLPAGEAIHTWSQPNTYVCGCTGQTQTPSYDPCHCVEIPGSAGYPTSAMCEEICCSGETSWSCVTGTTIAVNSSVDCGSRLVEIPQQMVSSQYFSNLNPIGYISNPMNGLQTTFFSDMKYVSDGTISASNNSVGEECHDVNSVMIPDGVARWEYIQQINAFTDTNNPVISTISWADFIGKLQSPPWNLAVTVNMTAAQVFSVTQSLGYSLNTCTCPGDPCGCIEIPGTYGYPTSASCETVCCPDPSATTTFNCTIQGCVPVMGGNGTFPTLLDCEEVCKEWICDEDGDCYGSCDTGGNNTPRTELPSWFFGLTSDILSYIASPATAPVQSPLLPPITGNMQQADITYYKFDCVNCSSPVQTCPSPNGTWWAPDGMYIESVQGTPPFVYSGPHNTWQDVVTAAQQQGFSVSLGTSYDDFTTILAADLREVVIKGTPCYGTPTGCDCVEIDGTGHTGGWYWSSSNYQPCVDACCSGETFDCTQSGCVPNLTNTGLYNSMSACTADCREWKCIPGSNNVDTCSGATFLNIDWSLIPTGLMISKAAEYFSDPANMLQYTPVSNYKVVDVAQGVNTFPTACEEQAFDPVTNPGMYTLRRLTYFTVPNSSLNNPDPAFPTANNYDPVTQQCPGIGCQFDSWSDLVTACQSLSMVNPSTGNIVDINDPTSQYVQAIYYHFGLTSPVAIRVYNDICDCLGTPCYCDELIGTGNTGNVYSDFPSCNLAANANPCCQPPDDWWTCQPGPTGPGGSGLGTLQGDCVCVQGAIAGSPGSYPTLQDCKDNPNNCCDRHYYDCLNQGTPQAGCVGLINGTPGPYQTAALCDQACPKIGYNCQLEDDGPGGSGTLACIPCIGLFCQYTHITAIGAPYYGDALQQCQDSCPANDCWKCCMDINGFITQLSPSLSPAQCVCPKETVEVQCDGSGPCPHPVSCIPGYVYNWTLCRCVCEPNVSCAPGYHWSYTECKCVPNSFGPVDFIGSEGEVLQSITEFKMLGGVRHIINDFTEGTELLEYMTKKGYYLGRDECTHCTDGTEGICVLDGCLYYPNYKEQGSALIGWKSLLVSGNDTISIGTTCTALDVNGYYPLYTTTSCAETHMGGNGTYHTHVLNGMTYYMPNGLVMGVTQFHGDYVITTTTPILTGATLNGYSCVDNPNNPPTYTECLEYGTAPYLAYFGNAAPQYSTLQDCYAAGCDFSGTVYYQCTVETNTLVGENQQACVPVDGVGGPGLFTSLEECLNSGCAGWMACDQTQVSEVNGVDIEANSLYPIPMCCESYINTATIPLTVTDCEKSL